MSGDLEAMLKRAAQHKMTPAEEHAQRRSWVIGQMMLSHPEMTREQAAALVDRAVGPNHAARVAELEAENARLLKEKAERDELTAAANANADTMEGLVLECHRLRVENARLREALNAVIHPNLVEAIARGSTNCPTPQLPRGNGQAERR